MNEVKMPNSSSPHDLFISYSRKNKDAVLPIKDEIERTLGLTCWVDLSDIPCGAESFKKKVIPGIRQTRLAFLFFLSAESQASEYAMKEINFAKKRARKRVILIRFNDDEMNDEFFFDYQDADVIDWRVPEQKGKLLRDLKGWSAQSNQTIESISPRTGSVKNGLPMGREGDSFVVCPFCGKKNNPTETFRCRECGCDDLCIRHQDEETYLCRNCAKKIRAESRMSREDAERRAGTTKMFTLPGGAKMELGWCPPGEFVMGSPENELGRFDNERQHHVRLTKGFWLGKYPVTQRQWESVMTSTPSHFKGEDLPVESVSWDDCQKFIALVNVALNCGARLPTEAEWEYACRAGTTGVYGGNGKLSEMGWYHDNSGGATHPVGLKKPNAWGLYDMHGNIWEWCDDGYGCYPSGFAIDPTNPVSRRCVLRGGAWINGWGSCRAASRRGSAPGYNSSCQGLRLCCSTMPHDKAVERW